MKKLMLASVMCLISFCSFAKTVTDFQEWVPINTTVKINENWAGFLELTPRFGHDGTILTTAILRPGIIYNFNTSWSVMLGYLMQSDLRKNTTGTYNFEHDVFEDLVYKNSTLGKQLSYSFRTRLEQRFLAFNNDPSIRLRARLKGEYKFVNSDWSIIGFDEIFINTVNNDNNPAIQAGTIDQNRAYAGVGYRINSAVQLETGYMFLYGVGHAGKPNAHVDIWQTSVNFNF
jgi:hypothetical protein